jgi:Flp pilus assembly protein TadG
MIFLVPLLLYGLLEVGRLVEVTQILNNAAREGGRQSSTGQRTDTEVQTIVLQYLQNEGLNNKNAVVTVTNLGFPNNPTPPDNNPKHAHDLDRFQITVTVPFQDVQWVSFGAFTGPNTVLGAQAVWSSMKDLDYPEPVPPSGS